MTIQEAIALADGLKPNQFPGGLKIRWLSDLDQRIFAEVLSTHAGSPVPSFDGYDGDTPQDTPLLVPPPWCDEVYVFYLQSAVDRENGETAKFNQSVTLFNNAFLAFQNWYNRSHPPLGAGGWRM